MIEIVWSSFNAKALKHIAYDARSFLSAHASADKVIFPWLEQVAHHAQGEVHRLTARVLISDLKCLVPQAIVNYSGRWNLAENPIACVLNAKRYDERHCQGMTAFINDVLRATARTVGQAAARCTQERLEADAVVTALNSGVRAVLVRSFPQNVVRA